MRTGQADRALTIFDEGLRTSPGSEPLLAGKASALIAMGRLDEAQTLLDPLFASGTPAPELVALRARVRQRTGQVQQGADELRAYIDSGCAGPWA